MGRKPKVQRSAEEKLTIVMEALKSGNVAETCRKFEIAPNLFYRWKDEVEKGALAALGGRSAAARPDQEQVKRINQLWQTDMTKVWAGASVGWAYLVSVIDCCTRDIVGWDLSLRCRTQEAIAAVEQRRAGADVGRLASLWAHPQHR
jgi:transposase-like protein